MKKLLLLLAFLPFTASASISAVGPFTSCRANPAPSCTVAHTVTGSNMAGVVEAVTVQDLAHLTGCTWNGTSMALDVYHLDVTSRTETGFYYINAPTTGNITCTINASTLIYHSDESYSGVSQTGQPVATSSTEVTSGTSVSNTLGGLTITGTSAVSEYIFLSTFQLNAVSGNDWLIGGLGTFPALSVFSAGANTILRGQEGDGRTGIIDSNDTTPISTSILNGTILNMGYGSLNSVHINQ
jgi:hypothetical protein